MTRKQIAAEGKYLYRMLDNYYIISKEVYLGKNDTEWEECTEEQKVEFEKHNQEEIEKELEVVEDENEN